MLTKPPHNVLIHERGITIVSSIPGQENVCLESADNKETILKIRTFGVILRHGLWKEDNCTHSILNKVVLIRFEFANRYIRLEGRSTKVP